MVHIVQGQIFFKKKNTRENEIHESEKNPCPFFFFPEPPSEQISGVKDT